MNKLVATLFAGVFTLTLGASAFAADTAKPMDTAKKVDEKVAAPAKTQASTPAAEPAKVEAATSTPAKANAEAKPAKKEHHKHALKSGADKKAAPEAKL